MNALVTQTAITDEGGCSGAGIRVDSGLDENRNSALDALEIQATEYLCEGGSATTPGLKVVDANGDTLGDALASDQFGVVLRTSTGYILTLAWDGAPVPLKYVLFASAGCTGAASIYNETGAGSIHEKSAFWSEPHAAFLVPTGTAVGGVIASVFGPYMSNSEQGFGCNNSPDNQPLWPAAPVTLTTVGLAMTIDAPIRLE